MPTSKTASITKTLAETIDFLTECISDTDGGLGKTQILDSHCSNLIEIIGNLIFELKDATAAKKLVRAHKSMIGADIDEGLRKATARSSGTTTRIKDKQPAASCDSQDHHHIENYLTEPFWALIRSDCPMHQKLAAMAKFVVDRLGLH